MGVIVGVDESGRGPIIGPLVMAAVAVEDDSDLPVGIKDSKLLTPGQRLLFADQIKKLPHVIIVIDPAEIDIWVFQKKLNWLEAEKTAELLNKLAKSIGSGKAILDCPSRNLNAYAAYVRDRAKGWEILAEFKADLNYPVVAAASILAKVTRDELVARIADETGLDIGSGYLTDPKTQVLLDTFNPDFPYYRKSWQPYKDRLANKQQKRLF